jgi:hypothetical protein
MVGFGVFGGFSQHIMLGVTADSGIATRHDIAAFQNFRHGSFLSERDSPQVREQSIADVTHAGAPMH